MYMGHRAQSTKYKVGHTSKLFLSLTWSKWAGFCDFLLKVSKKRGVCLLYHHQHQCYNQIYVITVMDILLLKELLLLQIQIVIQKFQKLRIQ